MNVNKNPIKLTILRMEKGLTRQQLADKSGVKERCIAEWERRIVPMKGVPVGKALAVCNALGCKIEDIIDD